MSYTSFIRYVGALLLCVASLGVWAQANPGATSQATASSAPTATLADIKTDLIGALHKDGYLSDKLAREASEKYISTQDKETHIQFVSGQGAVSSGATHSLVKDVGWTEYLSWVNFFKLVAVALLLFAFSGFIRKILKKIWHIVALAPAYVYQSVFLAGFVFALIAPHAVWASQAFYVALFAAFGVLIVVSWIFTVYPKTLLVLAPLAHVMPLPTLGAALLTFYFGGLALLYHSQVFGFFACVAFSGILSFSLFYMPGVLSLNFKESALPAMVWGHILAIAAFIGAYYSGIASTELSYFNAGLQYYFSTALGVALLVGASPWYRRSSAGLYVMLALVVAVAASALYFLPFSGLATVLLGFVILIFLEWLGYLGFKTHWIVGCALTGGTLYAAALLLERYGSTLMLALRAV